MDAITRGWLAHLALLHPGKAITLSHQFLDGSVDHECGLVPNAHSGSIYVRVK
jgi:hypothetical protein